MRIIVRNGSELTVELTVTGSTNVAYIKKVLREQLSEKKIIQDRVRYKDINLPEISTIADLSIPNNAELSYEYLDEENSSIQVYEHFGYDAISKGASILPMTISLSAPTTIDESNHVPIDVIICVDNSSSMLNIIDLVKTTLHFLISQLGSTDRFSIVKFSDTSSIVFELNYMTLEGRERANIAVDNLNPDGGSALCEGLCTAIDVMQKRKKKPSEVISSILLFTDGEANIGPQSNDEIKNAITNKIKNTDDFSIYTFGFSSDHNASLLQDISILGKGMYSYIENPDMISGSLVNCIAGLMSIVAKDICVNLEACNGSSFVNTSSSQPQLHYIDSTHLNIKIPDIQSGEKKNFLIEVNVPGCSSSSTEDKSPITVTPSSATNNSSSVDEKNSRILRMDMISSNMLLQSKDYKNKYLSIDRSDIKSSLNYEVSKTINRILLIETMNRIRYMTKHGNIIGARIAAMDAIQSIEKSISGSSDYCKNLIRDLQVILNTLKNDLSYISSGLFLISSSTQSHQYQRSSNPEQSQSIQIPALSSSYTTPFSQKMQCAYFSSSVQQISRRNAEHTIQIINS